MGKNKIKIEKIETAHGRKVTYKNRIGGLVKKAKELSILCDVPVLLVTASPNDELTLTVGPNSNFEGIIKQYADSTPEARFKSKMDTIEKLKKSCSEDGISVDIEQMYQRSLSSPMNNKSEGKNAHLKKLQNEISQIEHILGPLGQLPDLDEVESLDTLLQMESILLDALRLNDLEKDQFVQQVQIQCSSEVQNVPPQEVLIQPLDANSQYQSQSQSELWDEFNQMLDRNCSSELQNVPPQEVLVHPLDTNSPYQSQSQSELWDEFNQMLDRNCSSELQNVPPQEVLVQPPDSDSQYQSQSQSELWDEFNQMLDHDYGVGQ